MCLEVLLRNQFKAYTVRMLRNMNLKVGRQSTRLLLNVQPINNNNSPCLHLHPTFLRKSSLIFTLS